MMCTYIRLDDLGDLTPEEGQPAIISHTFHDITDTLTLGYWIKLNGAWWIRIEGPASVLVQEG